MPSIVVLMELDTLSFEPSISFAASFMTAPILSIEAVVLVANTVEATKYAHIAPI